VTTAGLLLAAGAGRRMGGPKALLRPDPDGPTLLETALAHLRAAGLDQVVAVLGAAADEAAPLAGATTAQVVVAEGWAEGMGASLRAGLAHLADAPAGVHAALVTLVDLPDVGPEVLARMAAAADAAGPDVLLRATYDGVPGHPVVLGRAHWAAVARTATGDRGARDHLATHPPTPVECGDVGGGRDLDQPADLEPARHPAHPAHPDGPGRMDP